MNRQQKRKLQRQIRKIGYGDQALLSSILERRSGYLKEGDKVMLNTKRITTDKNWDRKTDKYKDFVLGRSEDIFTVEYDPKYKENPILVCLKEDETPVKWLWHEDDLIKLEV